MQLHNRDQAPNKRIFIIMLAETFITLIMESLYCCTAFIEMLFGLSLIELMALVGLAKPFK